MTIYAWFDLETAGRTSARRDPILEIAMVLTDETLEPIPGASLTLVVKPSSQFDGWEGEMSDNVRRMHSRNGLLRTVPSGLPMAEVEQAFIDMISARGGGARVRPAGIGIDWFDLPRIEAHMPRLYRCFDRKTMDLAKVRRFLRDIAGHTQQYAGRGKHRAMSDVEDMLGEAQMLRDLCTP